MDWAKLPFIFSRNLNERSRDVIRLSVDDSLRVTGERNRRHCLLCNVIESSGRKDFRCHSIGSAMKHARILKTLLDALKCSLEPALHLNAGRVYSRRTRRLSRSIVAT